MGQLGKPQKAIVQQDLTNMSFAGVDFSGVTSFKGVKLDGSDLREAVLPKDPMLLVDAYGLENAQFPEGYITEEVLARNASRITHKVSDTIINRANGKEDYLSSKEEKNFRAEVNRIYNMDNPIGKKFRQSIQESPPSMNMYAARIPMQTSGFSNIGDYKGKTTNTLVTLYANKHNPENLEKTLVSNYIADDISKLLFKEGHNRGEDGIAIRKGINEAVTRYLDQNDALKPMSLIETENYEEMISALSQDILDKAYPTFVGRLENLVTLGNSDRIQLEGGAFDEDLIEKIKHQMNYDAGVLELNEQENEVLEEMAEEIGNNLFGSGARGQRSEDVDMIFNALYDVVYELKVENNERDITEILQEKQKEIVGKVDKGWFSTERTGLTEIFYNASENTTANLATLGLKGGIQLNEKSTESHKFMQSVKEHMCAEHGVEVEG